MSGIKLRLMRGGYVVDSGGTAHEIKEIKLGSTRVWYPPTISPASNTYQAAGDSCNFTIDACCPWEISEYPSWLTLSQTEGDSGQTIVTATAGPNETGSQLSGRILVTYKHTVMLWASAYVYQNVGDSISISPVRVMNISADGEAIAVAITTSGTWEISAQSMLWATARKRAGSSSETIYIDVDENTTGSERNGTITFENGTASATLQLYQLAVITPSTFEVVPTDVSATYFAQLIQFYVTADAAWTASTSASWITLSASGGSAGTLVQIVASIQRNTGTRQRVGLITFTCGSQTITAQITQDASSL